MVYNTEGGKYTQVISDEIFSRNFSRDDFFFVVAFFETHFFKRACLSATTIGADLALSSISSTAGLGIPVTLNSSSSSSDTSNASQCVSFIDPTTPRRSILLSMMDHSIFPVASKMLARKVLVL